MGGCQAANNPKVSPPAAAPAKRLRICFSEKFLGDADAADALRTPDPDGTVTTLQEQALLTLPCKDVNPSILLKALG